MNYGIGRTERRRGRKKGRKRKGRERRGQREGERRGSGKGNREKPRWPEKGGAAESGRGLTLEVTIITLPPENILEF